MNKVYFTPLLFTQISSSPVENVYIEVNENQQICSITTKKPERQKIEKLNGIVVPTFFNAHLHLEHSGYCIERVDNLLDFIEKIKILKQNYGYNKRQMKAIDNQLYSEGIDFCIDIANTDETIYVKNISKIKYFTFIELYGLDVNRSDEIFHDGLLKSAQFNEKGLPSTITFHSVYSLSKKLMEKTVNYNSAKSDLISFHFLESCNEYNLKDFHKDLMKLSNSSEQQPAFSDLNEFLSFLKLNIPEHKPIILVHNIYINETILEFFEQNFESVFYCLCPSSNFFIEKRFVEKSLIDRIKKNILLGTDGQASNPEMSLVREMYLLQENSNLSFGEILDCVTINPAKLMSKIKSDFYSGTIEEGKKANLVEICNFDFKKFRLTEKSFGQRIL